MDFQTYRQKTIAFAEYPRDSRRQAMNYLITALIGESGELCNVVKKYMRGDKQYQGFDDRRSKLIEELGGILWYVSELCNILGIYPKPPKDRMYRAGINLATQSRKVVYACAGIGYFFDEGIGSEDDLVAWTREIESLITALENFCVEATRITFEEIMDANITLLESRREENGTIKDHDV